jgi:hypothetical protein
MIDGWQMAWAQRMLALLNIELHHDGAWVIVFTHPHSLIVSLTAPQYRQFRIMWLDVDGDPQFTLEWAHGEAHDEFDFAAVVLTGIEAWGQKCEECWLHWHRLMRETLEPAEGQTFRRARGERPHSMNGR